MYVRGTSRMPEHTGCFASLRSGERRGSVLPILVLRLRKSAAGKSVLGTRRRKTSRPRGREALSFTGFGMKFQQGVFGEWPASCPTCEFRKWGLTLTACAMKHSTHNLIQQCLVAIHNVVYDTVSAYGLEMLPRTMNLGLFDTS